MKLNLGSGGKRIEGYLSVDLVTGRINGDDGTAGEVDIIADIRNMPDIADGSVEEIISIHVIEHFYEWEVDPMLREWRRILMPGGKLIIECPDILRCAVNLLQVYTTQHQTLIGKLGLFGVYGDPRGADPMMAHKWGWMPQTLSAALHDAGYERVTVAMPQYHEARNRDMRLEAYKPC